MSAPPRLPGVVLAGGGSTRFGRPKGEARLGHLTLVERAWRSLAPLCGEVWVGRPPELPDLRPGRGPLAGIEAALTRARDRGADGVVVLACDLPVVHTATLARLLEAWRRAPDPRRAVAVPHDPLQPLCGVWGVGALPAVAGALDADRGSARDLVRGLADAVRVDAGLLADELGLPPGELLLNVNRPEDLEAARGLAIPPVVSVVGWKDSGKTTVAVALVRALAARGVDVAAAKHGHGFRLDAEGTDSWRLRHEGGARRVLLAGPEGMVLMGGWRDGEPGLAGLVRRHLRDAALVVAEGWKSEPWPAVEVRGAEALATPDPDRWLAVVGGAGQDAGVPMLGRDDPALGEALADLVEARILSLGR